MVTPDEVISEAQEWINTPFRHQANPGLKGIATDCVGYVRGVANACGIEDQYEDGNTYPRVATGQLIQYLVTLLVHVEQIRVGDIVLFGMGDNEHHIGIYDGKYILHAHEEIGKVVRTRYVGSMRDKSKGIFRFKELCSSG